MIRTLWRRLTATNPKTIGQRPVKTAKPALEILEERCVLSAVFRSFDGTGNNLVHTDWGSANTQLLRLAPAEYGDGISTPAGADLPSARVVSNAVMAETTEVLNDRMMSDFIYVFGQFLDHDLSLTPNGKPTESFNIAVPTGDPFFDPNGTGTQVIRLARSQFDPATGVSNPRQQTTIVSSWLDGSQIYGSSQARADALRSGIGGQLKTSAGNLLPFNTMGLDNQSPHGADPARFFVAGDIRANENVELTALQTLWMREHNLVASRIQSANPALTDEEIYQRARQWVIAELQVITYKEYLPAMLGTCALKPYAGYRPTVNPGIANEFSTAAFRVGHTFLGDDVEFLDNDGHEIRPEVSLAEAFFNPELLSETNIDPILKYLSTDKAREGDAILVNGVRNFLFGPPGAGGLDLGALDIQRARDHGLADYNSIRAAYGLPRIHSFAQITSDKELQRSLRGLYGNVNNIDVFAGGLAEDHAPGASVGPLFQRIIADQFARLRDADRFWYQRTFSGAALAELQKTTLSDVIRRNTTITKIQDNAFFFEVTVRGRVFLDQNRDGRPGRHEPGIPQITVQLLAADGTVIATTRTQADGTYRFVGRIDGPGKFKIRLVPPHSWKVTSSNPVQISVTRGEVFNDIQFGVFPDAKPAKGSSGGKK